MTSFVCRSPPRQDDTDWLAASIVMIVMKVREAQVWAAAMFAWQSQGHGTQATVGMEAVPVFMVQLLFFLLTCVSQALQHACLVPAEVWRAGIRNPGREYWIDLCLPATRMQEPEMERQIQIKEFADIGRKPSAAQVCAGMLRDL